MYPLFIVSAIPIRRFVIEVVLSSGKKLVMDIEKYMDGDRFSQMRVKPYLFYQMFLDEESGMIVWGNGAKIPIQALIPKDI